MSLGTEARDKDCCRSSEDATQTIPQHPATERLDSPWSWAFLFHLEFY